jgi:type I restriction enzyme M protein
LLDAYDVYQHLMDYWAETMQDDVYMIASDGWREAAKPRLIIEEKEKKSKEKPDFTVGKQKFKAELVPPALMIARYFSTEQAAIENLEAEVSSIEQKLEELKEEHSGEEGLLSEVLDDKGNISKGAVEKRFTEIEGDKDAEAERVMLAAYYHLLRRAVRS